MIIENVTVCRFLAPSIRYWVRPACQLELWHVGEWFKRVKWNDLYREQARVTVSWRETVDRVGYVERRKSAIQVS